MVELKEEICLNGTKKSSKDKKKIKKKSKKVDDIKAIEDDDNTSPPPKKKKKSKKVKEETKDLESEICDDKVSKDTPEAKGDFSNFRITPKTIKNLKQKGITYLFDIQVATFDHIYDGKDVIAQARTGTGKTMSFVLPIIEKMLSEAHKFSKYGRSPKVVVMAPTRELAVQVHKDFVCVKQNLSSVCVYGGTTYGPQESAMRSGVDIVVGTPGRMQDHITKGNLDLSEVDFVVLDEVDQMLDMGFAPSVEQILSYAYTKDRPQPPQTLLFSATCPSWVTKTANKYMRKENMVHVDTIGESTLKTATTVQHLAIRCGWQERAICIANCVQLYSGQHGRAIIFTETKNDANALVVHEDLQRQKPQALHGDIEQRQRNITLQAFRDGNIRCLVATNVAARGLDIPEVDLVIQSCPPKDYESYVHRSGRTGRAGRTGTCICFFKPSEEGDLKWVESKAGIKFKIVGPPQPKDIVESSISDTVTSLEAIDKKLTSNFMKYAEKLAQSYEGGATEALAAAIAWISGAAKLESRSLLCSKAGHTTWQLSCQCQIRFNGFVYSMLEKNFGADIRNQCVGLRLTKDKLGAVFDLPDDVTDTIESSWKDSKFMTLAKAEALPDLEERHFSQGGGRYGGRGGYNRGGYNRGGYNRGGYNRGGYNRSNGYGGGRGNSRGLKRKANF